MEEAEGVGVLYQAVGELGLLLLAEDSFRQVVARVADAPLVGCGGVGISGPCVVVGLLLGVHDRDLNCVSRN